MSDCYYCGEVKSLDTGECEHCDMWRDEPNAKGQGFPSELRKCPCGGDAEHLRAGDRGVLCRIRCVQCGLGTVDPLPIGDARNLWDSVIARTLQKGPSNAS